MCLYEGVTKTQSSSSIYDCLTTEFEDSTADGTSTCISCTLTNVAVDTCVVVVHPKPSFIHDSLRGLQDISVILLNKSTGDGACSGCIDDISLSDYVVAIFPYQNGTILSGSHVIVKPQRQSTYSGIIQYYVS